MRILKYTKVSTEISKYQRKNENNHAFAVKPAKGLLSDWLICDVSKLVLDFKNNYHKTFARFDSYFYGTPDFPQFSRICGQFFENLVKHLWWCS